MRALSPLLLFPFGLALALPAGCGDNLPHPLLAFELTPPRALTYLRYRVQSSSGEATREFAVGRDEFAELRHVADRTYVLGLRGDEAWMRVGANPPVEIEGPLAADERRDAAWVGMRFAERASGARTELESCHGPVCTFVHVPRDGAALWIDVNRANSRPVALSWVTRENAVDVCEDVEWNDEEGAPAVASATCSAIVDHVGRETTHWTLEERRTGASAPSWMRVAPEEILPLRPLRDVASFPIADPSTRIYVPVRAGGSDPLELVVDTGSPWTVLKHGAMNAAGVVPSLDPPLHVRPPYLPEATYDCAIVDRLFLGDVELHGVRVLVAREDYAAFSGNEAGLLGMDVLSRFLTDVDGPASTLRLWPHDDVVTAGWFTDVPFEGASHHKVIVEAEITGLITKVPLIVDTGAPVNVIIGGPGMHAHYPHHRTDEVALLEDGDTSDYLAEIDGFRLGPFAFPKMPAYGHDRRPELPFLDDDSALVGLGVLRHLRIVIDARDAVLHIAPGPSYAVLTRFGLEIDTRNGSPTITRVLGAEHQWNTPFREGDVVRAVNGRAIATRDDALDAIARSARVAQLIVERQGKPIARSAWAREQ